jgi:hypothetical protein
VLSQKAGELMFRNGDVAWVLLAGGLWYPVVAGTFELELIREWSEHGTFAYGFSFCSGDYRLHGPATNLVAIAIPR